MSQLKVGDRVKIILSRQSADSWRLFGKIGTILATRSSWCVLDIEGSNPGGIYYDEIIKIGEPVSKYDELKQRIEALNGQTTLQDFGELLLAVGSESRYVNIPTYVGNSFEVQNDFRRAMNVLSTMDDACNAIPCLKEQLMWLLNDNKTIKKSDKSDKIAELKKQADELQARIKELENE